jgi:hypothetical protein
MIYLLDDGGHPIGPFKNREEVERFIGMMALCGENWADHEIVPGGSDDAPMQNPARADSCADRFKSTR